MKCGQSADMHLIKLNSRTFIETAELYLQIAIQLQIWCTKHLGCLVHPYWLTPTICIIPPFRQKFEFEFTDHMHICQQGITIHSTLQIIFFFSFNNLSARWIIFISADKIISQHSEDLDSDAFVESRSSNVAILFYRRNPPIKWKYYLVELLWYAFTLRVRSVGRYASYKTEFENFYRNGGIILADRYTTSNMVHQASRCLVHP